LKEKVASIEADSRKALDEAIEESNLKVYPNELLTDRKVLSVREDCDQKISAMETKWEIAQSNLAKSNEKKDTEKRRLTRQVHPIRSCF
jgi:DNA polymerase II large subunit